MDGTGLETSGSAPAPAELLQQLLRFRTVNPPGGEAVCIGWLEGLLRVAGLDTRIFAKDPARPNLVARLRGRGDAPPLLMHGHVDVVPVDGQRWRHPPFAGIIDDGEIWGRGALDMKGGVAMMVSAALRANSAEGPSPAGDVILTLLSDEETGGAMGAGFLVEDHAELFDGAKHAIGEFGGFTMHLGGRRFYPIQVAEKQLCTLLVRLQGAAGHGALAHSGRVTSRLSTLLAQADRKLPIHVQPIVARMLDEIAHALPILPAAVVRSVRRGWLTGPILKRMGPRGAMLEPMLRNTVSANVVRAGQQFNVVPAEATVMLDGRILPGMDSDDLIRELRHVLGTDADIEVLRFQAAARSPDLSLLGLLSDVLRTCDPEAVPIPWLLPASTDGRFFERIGIQHYGFLPLRLPPSLPFNQLVHAADERVPVDALDFGVRALGELLLRYRG